MPQESEHLGVDEIVVVQGVDETLPRDLPSFKKCRLELCSLEGYAMDSLRIAFAPAPHDWFHAIMNIIAHCSLPENQLLISVRLSTSSYEAFTQAISQLWSVFMVKPLQSGPYKTFAKSIIPMFSK
ncbi:MAG TPA: hypothetical protein PLW73_11295 [Methanoregulaceae archaeon]|nr:hypothetical protein [Methanoregulaceae archaeon]